ncbi:MAG: hypothetical protein U5O15_10670 [Candidatus Krumholzibacteriota bacterium]|nr:hypothetical protein [Candidatus Krumholzibacteriota bacterium]
MPTIVTPCAAIKAGCGRCQSTYHDSAGKFDLDNRGCSPTKRLLFAL